MRTALHRIGAGALAYIVSYALIGIVAVLDVTHSVESPLWQGIGWITLNVHKVPIAALSGRVNPISDGGWLGLIHSWVGLIPMVACLLVGVTVAVCRQRSSLIPLSVGAYMTPGYFFAVLASAVVFTGPFGPVDALLSTGRFGRWLVYVLFTPFIFGTLGALLGQSPVLTATIERLRSGPSLR